MSTSMQLHRVDYAQVGLCSTNCLKVMTMTNGQLLLTVGDQSGAVSGFLIKPTELGKANLLFRTLPVGQSSVSCIQMIASGSPKIFSSYENGAIRCFTRRGKEFFGLELSHLTEPIRHFRIRWPSELFIAGLHTFNQFLLNSGDLGAGNESENFAGNRNLKVQTGVQFVCPAPITDLLVIHQKINRKTVSLLACEDRLIRVLFDSACEYEIETCGIVSCVLQLGDLQTGTKSQKTTGGLGRGQIKPATLLLLHFCYGTLDGRLSLVRIDFGQPRLQAEHCWEIHLPRSRAAIQCLAVDATLNAESSLTISNQVNRVGDTFGTDSASASFSANDPPPPDTSSELEPSVSELLVGRADGTVELFSFSFSLAADGIEYVDVTSQPRLRSEFKAAESVTGLQVCMKGQLILASSFTGMVFALLRSESLDSDLTDRLDELELECEGLETKLTKERIRYQEQVAGNSTSLASGGAAFGSTSSSRSLTGIFDQDHGKFALSALPGFKLNESFVLQDGKKRHKVVLIGFQLFMKKLTRWKSIFFADASYLLTLECEAAIDCVLVQSDIPLDLMDCERNSAVVSFNDPQYEMTTFVGQPDGQQQVQTQSNSSNGMLATFRCQADTRQLQIRVCTIEGHFGLIRVYVLSRLTPKVCQVRHFTVKALSLHKRKYFDARRKLTSQSWASESKSRLDDLDEQDELLDDMPGDVRRSRHQTPGSEEKTIGNETTPANNQMVLLGSFSLAEAHSWLYNALPEVPEKLTFTSGTVYTFECKLTGSSLRVQLTKGRLNITSTSVSSISILKEFCTREATRKSIAVELKVRLSQESLGVCLAGVFRRLKPLIRRKHYRQMQEAIAELSVGNPDEALAMATELGIERRTLDRIRRLQPSSSGEEMGGGGSGVTAMDDEDGVGNGGGEDEQSQTSGNDSVNELERLYGLIADLYIDFQKLKGNAGRTFIQSVRSRVGDMIALIEQTLVVQDCPFDTFLHKLNAFWGFESTSN